MGRANCVPTSSIQGQRLISSSATSCQGWGGAPATPVNLDGRTNARSAGSTVEINNTTVATNGSPVTLLAEKGVTPSRPSSPAALAGG